MYILGNDMRKLPLPVTFCHKFEKRPFMLFDNRYKRGVTEKGGEAKS